jgi:hypothetical protein
MQRRRVDPSAVSSSYLPLLKELNGDFRGHFFNCALHFLGGVRQSICVDVNSDPTSLAAHVIAELEAPDRLLKLVTALRALKTDHKRVRSGHFALPVKDGVGSGPAERARDPLFARE